MSCDTAQRVNSTLIVTTNIDVHDYQRKQLLKKTASFYDPQKAFYRTQAFGNIGPVPARADITVNPTILVFISNTISNR